MDFVSLAVLGAPNLSEAPAPVNTSARFFRSVAISLSGPLRLAESHATINALPSHPSDYTYQPRQDFQRYPGLAIFE